MAARRATVYTVADRAGVSVATVSRVLASPQRVAEGTRERVLAAVAELDYVPHGAAQSLAAHRHAAHGLVLPELSGPYYAELLLGYESAVAERDESLIVSIASEQRDLDAALRRLAANVDGMVIMSAHRLAPHTLSAIRQRIPVLGLADGDDVGLESWRTANDESARSLAQHLADHGRTRALFVGDPDLATDIAERHAGFRSVFGDATEPIRTPLRERDGYEVAAAILDGTIRADALMCANDELAVAIVSALVDGGVAVGRDISIVGWDDIMAARFTRPALTTVRQPVVELGAGAARRMRAMIDAPGEPLAPAPTLATEIVVRDSCGAHP
ncbi:LacI family DNA-binding transcriptional regulator [Agrococcus jejuensis]|uniref:Transcriptional regulator, LacI family n=1 Tax=Agrococcus jejuensis TaxID=399736 RepID=A0A1G8BFF8_9MICO|nr:LacI family DNA-binding transcriptional regulator [Agrococcus jejuensis]SDH31330.1 transcriptional regulator, LacI family [Agrococcus jejuensis]